MYRHEPGFVNRERELAACSARVTRARHRRRPGNAHRQVLRAVADGATKHNEVAEAKWARTVDARRVEAALLRKAEALGAGDVRSRWPLANGRTTRPTLAITAAEIFAA